LNVIVNYLTLGKADRRVEDFVEPGNRNGPAFDIENDAVLVRFGTRRRPRGGSRAPGGTSL